MSAIKEKAILDICACTGLELTQVYDKTKGMGVSELEALGVFVRTGIRFDVCKRLAAIAGNEDMAFSMAGAMSRKGQLYTEKTPAAD